MFGSGEVGRPAKYQTTRIDDRYTQTASSHNKPCAHANNGKQCDVVVVF